MLYNGEVKNGYLGLGGLRGGWLRSSVDSGGKRGDDGDDDDDDGDDGFVVDDGLVSLLFLANH